MCIQRVVRVACVLVIGGFIISNTAWADWDPGDYHKMHFPQLPDTSGWDVYGENCVPIARELADDWMCSQTGLVTDIHLWGSWEGDIVGTISNFHISIYEDAGGESPGVKIWEHTFGSGDFTTRLYYESTPGADLGWFNPFPDNYYYTTNDHKKIFQYNFLIDEADAFTQIEGTLYWLGVTANWDGCEWGWTTSQNHFGDNAHYYYDPDRINDPPYGSWGKLYDPVTSEDLDLAFVITPEPATMGLLVIGGLAMTRRRKR